MIDEDSDDVGNALPFARSYDSFKHTTGIALLSLGGVFAFADGDGMQFKPLQIVVILAFIATAGITSLLMTGSLATLEVKPESYKVIARRIRVAQLVVGFSLFGGLGGFTYNYIAELLK